MRNGFIGIIAFGDYMQRTALAGGQRQDIENALCINNQLSKLQRDLAGEFLSFLREFPRRPGMQSHFI